MIELIQVLDDHLRVVLFIGILTAIVLTSLFKWVTKMYTAACRERTRREIAAYIAEGSMTPDQGERLMRADVNKGGIEV